MSQQGNEQTGETYHMDWESFRSAGYELIDWIADYHRSVENLPVRSQVSPGDVRAGLSEQAPEHGESWSAIMADINEHVLPGLTHWQSPNFFAFFPANTSGPSILGELLSAGLGVQGMLWETSPACTEVETLVLDWLVDILALPEAFRGNGVIQDSASSATLCAIIAARERVLSRVSSAERPETLGALCAYGSTQAHSSLEKGIRVAGLDPARLRYIDVDENFALKPEALEEAIAQDLRDGLIPFFVCANVGSTSSTAIDPVAEIGAHLRALSSPVWLHVDAALAGTAAVCEEYRFIHRGLDSADSYCFNPHKWMFTNFDCDAFYVRDRSALIHALSVLPEYLRNRASESGAVIDYRDWQVPLGRRFRALKLWFVIRHYGVEGLRYHVRRHIALAQEFAEWVRADDEFELAVEPALNLVCFYHRAGDETTESIEHAVNDTGKAYLTHTKLNGRYTLRLSVGQTYTERRHVRSAWSLLKEQAAGRSPEIP